MIAPLDVCTVAPITGCSERTNVDSKETKQAMDERCFMSKGSEQQTESGLINGIAQSIGRFSSLPEVVPQVVVVYRLGLGKRCSAARANTAI